MKTYNYFYSGTPISKTNFLNAVPENWENEVTDGLYSYGYYNAVEVDNV